MNIRTSCKRVAQLAFMIPAALLFLWWKAFAMVMDKNKAFKGISQFLALWPGLFGIYLRAAFYRLALPGTSQDTSIEFLSSFSNHKASLAPNVAIGACCVIGWAEIGEHCLISSMVSICSGRRQHGTADPETPMRLQAGAMEKVTIGRDCWVGNMAVIAADVGEGSIIAAGSVVIKPVPPFSVAAGNPARVIGRRGGG